MMATITPTRRATTKTTIMMRIVSRMMSHHRSCTSSTRTTMAAATAVRLPTTTTTATTTAARRSLSTTTTAPCYSWSLSLAGKAVAAVPSPSPPPSSPSSPTSRFSRRRYFSSAPLVHEKYSSIRILYASQGGTAQIFAMQLMGELEEKDDDNLEVSMEAWNEVDEPKDLLLTTDNNNCLHVFLCSTTGVGEPPDNGREFYNYVMSNDAAAMIGNNLDYCVFGLGNLKAHPNHYNAIGKSLDARLLELKANRILPLGLGDDGDCIEDDFDTWQEQFVKLMFSSSSSSSESDEADKASAVEEEEDSTQPREPDDDATTADTTATDENVIMAPCPGSKAPCGTRPVSAKYPQLLLGKSKTEIVRTNLIETNPEVYAPGSRLWKVKSNKCMNSDPVASGLWEIQLEPDKKADNPTNDQPLYEAGDHLLITPRNLDCTVEAYLFKVLKGVNPHAVVQGIVDTSAGVDDVDSINADGSKKKQKKTKTYPYPTGITVYETLSHCVDLNAVPSPAWCRNFLGKKYAADSVDYKTDVAGARRTMIDLLLQYTDGTMSLEDFLFASTPLQGRHYSIASAQEKNPNRIYLTYRPVKYVTTQGHLREGSCTSMMSNLRSIGSRVVAATRSNPTFRLPAHTKTPIAMLAGGCGVAPIRAFIEQRIEHANSIDSDNDYGPSMLFLGFRNPADEVYQNLIKEAMEVGALTDTYVTYTTGCPSGKNGLVSDAVRENGEQLYEQILNSGGYLYVCGGARAFGVAIENELLDIYQKYGGCDTEDQATQALRDLSNSGRLNEDLAD